MRIVQLTLIVLCLSAGVLCASDEAPCEGNLFNVQQYDEIVLKDGKKYSGRVSETDEGNYKVVDLRTNVIQNVRKDDVRTVRYKSTKEGELERLVKENASNPRKLLCVFIEATTRFNLQAKSIEMLEQITRSNANEGLLQKL